MKRYTITHGNIAAMIYVIHEGHQHQVVFLSGDKQPELTKYHANVVHHFEDFPLEVRAAVNKQFGQVFSLPIERRQEWIKAQVPFTIEVPDADG